MTAPKEVIKIFKAVKKELCSRKGLGWDELDEITGCDGLEKEVDNAVKEAIKKAMPDHDTKIQALKADLEALVKMYGDKKNWIRHPLTGMNVVVLEPVGGKLAREIGDKRGVKYE